MARYATAEMYRRSVRLATQVVAASRQLFQQDLGLLQITGLEPFGKPAVEVGQHSASFFALALALPKTTQVHHRPQLKRLRLLLTCDLDGLVEALGRLRLVGGSMDQEHFPLKPIQ